MQKQLDLNLNHQFSVKNENLGGFLLSITPKLADGNPTVIADLNRVSLGIKLKNKRTKKDVVIFNGFLQDFLIALYAQTTEYDINIEQVDGTYHMFFEFGQFPIKTTADVELEFTLNVSDAAFTDCDASKSTCVFQSYQVSELPHTSHVLSVQSDQVGNGSLNYEEPLPNHVFRAIVTTDLGATYAASNKANVLEVDISSPNYNVSENEDLLIAKNQRLLAVNPDSDIRNLVVYNSATQALNNATMKVKFSEAVDNDAKVITVSVAAV